MMLLFLRGTETSTVKHKVDCGPVNLGVKAHLSLDKEEKLDPKVEGRGLLH